MRAVTARPGASARSSSPADVLAAASSDSAPEAESPACASVVGAMRAGQRAGLSTSGSCCGPASARAPEPNDSHPEAGQVAEPIVRTLRLATAPREARAKRFGVRSGSMSPMVRPGMPMTTVRFDVPSPATSAPAPSVGCGDCSVGCDDCAEPGVLGVDAAAEEYRGEAKSARSPTTIPSTRIRGAGRRKGRKESGGTGQWYRVPHLTLLASPWTFAPRPGGHVYLIVVVCARRPPLHSLLRCRPVGGEANDGRTRLKTDSA